MVSRSIAALNRSQLWAWDADTAPQNSATSCEPIAKAMNIVVQYGPIIGFDFEPATSLRTSGVKSYSVATGPSATVSASLSAHETSAKPATTMVAHLLTTP